MANPLTEIYDVLFTKIDSVDPGKFWIDMDTGQLDKDGGILPIRFPAVLLRFEDVIWKDKDITVQIGVVTITVKYVHRFTVANELLSTNAPRSEIISCLETLLAIHNKLNKTYGTSFTMLKRINQFYRKTIPKDMLFANVLQYQCNIQSDGLIPADGTGLIIDYDDIRNNNSFLERRKFNWIHK